MSDAPTKEEIRVALVRLEWLKDNVAKLPRKTLQPLLEDATEVLIAGWKYLCGELLGVSGAAVAEAIRKATLPLEDKQKNVRGGVRRTMILTGDGWVLRQLKDTDGRPRIRRLVMMAQSQGRLNPDEPTETHVVRIMRIRPQWLDSLDNG
jgi:hypothetical protein